MDQPFDQPDNDDLQRAVKEAQGLRAAKARQVEEQATNELRALLAKHRCRIEPVLSFGPQITTTIRLVWEG